MKQHKHIYLVIYCHCIDIGHPHNYSERATGLPTIAIYVINGQLVNNDSELAISVLR